MLTKRQIEVIGRAVEAQEEALSSAEAQEVEAYAEELTQLEEIKLVLTQMYNDQAEVDADDMGEMYAWALEERNKYGSHPAYALFIEFGRFMGKIEAGYVTEEDWVKMQNFKAWLP